MRRYSAETSYWPELAGAKLAESSGTGRNPHIITGIIYSEVVLVQTMLVPPLDTI